MITDFRMNLQHDSQLLCDKRLNILFSRKFQTSLKKCRVIFAESKAEVEFDRCRFLMPRPQQQCVKNGGGLMQFFKPGVM